MSKIIKFFSLPFAWDQKVAFIISKPFIYFNIHPNIVTFIGILLGFVSFFLYSSGNLFFAKIASLFFFLAACFDHVDGVVARKLKKTSVMGHYLDHLGVCISYVILFIGLGLYEEKNFNTLGLNHALVSAFCIFLIMSIRLFLERLKGGSSIHQNNILGFEQEDLLYLIIPITFFDKIGVFLYYSYLGTPIFLIITLVIFIFKIKKS